MEYDFLIAPDEPPKTFAETPLPGPNLNEVAKMTPKKFAEDVLKVYNKLGNTTWLLREAQADPATFMKLLVKLLPKQLDLGSLEGMTVKLIDQFGQSIEIGPSSTFVADSESAPADSESAPAAAGPAESPPSSRSGQPRRTATGGSLPSVNVVDMYE